MWKLNTKSAFFFNIFVIHCFWSLLFIFFSMWRCCNRTNSIKCVKTSNNQICGIWNRLYHIAILRTRNRGGQVSLGCSLNLTYWKVCKKVCYWTEKSIMLSFIVPLPQESQPAPPLWRRNRGEPAFGYLINMSMKMLFPNLL